MDEILVFDGSTGDPIKVCSFATLDIDQILQIQTLNKITANTNIVIQISFNGIINKKLTVRINKSLIN